MPDPTLKMIPDWDKPYNHEAPNKGGWHGEAELKAIALDGFKLLRLNTMTIRQRGASSLGPSTFYKNLSSLAAATTPSAPPWTAGITKGIHQFRKSSDFCMPHITVCTPYGTAHFWLAIGSPVQLINSDVSTVLMPKVDFAPQNYGPDQAGFQYRVAQVSLSVDGPFFPRQVSVQVWTPEGLGWRLLPKA